MHTYRESEPSILEKVLQERQPDSACFRRSGGPWRNGKGKLVERVKSGLEQAKRQGKVLGRKPGTTKPAEVILKENSKAVGYIKGGRSVRETAKLCDIAPNTVMKVKPILQSA